MAAISFAMTINFLMDYQLNCAFLKEPVSQNIVQNYFKWFCNHTEEKKMKKTLLNKLGLLGVVSLMSYMAAVVFAPLKYPGYNWMAQAVSDLSAANAPSLQLWNQLSCLYGVCNIVSIMMVCVGVQGKLTKLLRLGIYIFAGMEWVSAVGFTMFPLSDSGYAGTFQDKMHIVATTLVVVLSLASLILIIISGIRNKKYRSYSIWAAVALLMMLIGAVGMNLIPQSYFGIVERFSVFAATGFNAVLGIYLFLGFEKNEGGN